MPSCCLLLPPTAAILPIRQSFHFKTKYPKGATQVGFRWHFFPGRMLPKVQLWSIKIRRRGLKSAFSICVSRRIGVVTGAFRETSICGAAQEQQSATAVTNALSSSFSLALKANIRNANIRTDRPHASASMNICSDAGPAALLSRQSWRSSWQQRRKPESQFLESSRSHVIPHNMDNHLWNVYQQWVFNFSKISLQI